VLLAVLSSLSSRIAWSAPDAGTLATVVVTAARSEQKQEETIASTIVITREQIERAGILTLAELLQRFGAAEIRSTGGAGQPSSVFLRGANSNHTLVLVDGLRVNSATSGAAALEHLPIDNIERIEIVKGALSGLYGSDALGGVVQIFTRRDAKPRLDASFGVAHPDQMRAALGLASTERDTELVFDAGYNNVRRAFATKPGAPFGIHNPDRDPYRQAFASFLLAHTLWQGEKVALKAWQSKGRADFDDGPGPKRARNTQTLDGAQLLSTNRFAQGWLSRLSIGRTRDESRVESSFGGLFRTQQQQVSWLHEFASPYGQMTLGAEWRREKVAGDVGYAKDARETASVFTSYSERLYGGQFEFSLRRDEADGKLRRNSGSVGYAFELAPGLRAHARGARGFRLPTFNDLYFPGFSNPALRPEESSQYEGGLRATLGGWRVSALHFSNQIRDLIAFDPALFQPNNIARARITGTEIEAGGRLARVDLRATLTQQTPVDRASGKTLQGRARQFGTLEATTAFGAWTAGVNLAGVGHRFDSRNESATSRMGGYTLIGASLRYRIDARWSLDLSAQNFGDKRYELAKGYETPRRSLLLNVRVAL
jgi:vitamin B12 transporter